MVVVLVLERGEADVLLDFLLQVLLQLADGLLGGTLLPHVFAHLRQLY